MKTTKVEWYSKEEAGVRLGSPERPLSPRRVLELAKEGKLESARVRDPKTGQTVIRIQAGSVERFLDERNAPPPPIPDPPPRLPGEVREPQGPPQPPHALIKRAPELLALAQLLRDGHANGTVAAQPARLWLTLDEAEAYSGLPEDHLLEAIQSRELPARDVGIRRGVSGWWRVRKSDLDNLGAAHE